MTDFEPTIHRHVDSGQTCCDPDWEAAYERFESPEEEIQKFIRRLRGFGLDRQPRDTRVVELFCGRGGGLVALERLGLTNIQGVDLSETLLKMYRGIATLHLADCRDLPFENHCFDAAIVQGGLHHLPALPEDLEAVLAEVSRILKPGGTFYVVEPWLTPFLRIVHAIVQQPWVRRVYAKGDALAEMIEHERETYQQWLNQPAQVLDAFERRFDTIAPKAAWGKLLLTATTSNSDRDHPNHGSTSIGIS